MRTKSDLGGVCGNSVIAVDREAEFGVIKFYLLGLSSDVQFDLVPLQGNSF